MYFLFHQNRTILEVRRKTWQLVVAESASGRSCFRENTTIKVCAPVNYGNHGNLCTDHRQYHPTKSATSTMRISTAPRLRLLRPRKLVQTCMAPVSTRLGSHIQPPHLISTNLPPLSGFWPKWRKILYICAHDVPDPRTHVGNLRTRICYPLQKESVQSEQPSRRY